MLQIVLFLLPGILCSDYNVMFPEPSICGVRGSSVFIPCNYTYPKDQQINVTQLIWCSKTQKDKCDTEGPCVYNSTNKNNITNFQYTGDTTSNCSLLISNINLTNSGEYIFRFVTSVEIGRYTSATGVKVTVTDLRVSMTRLRVNGTIKAGDSLNLTCTVSCPGHLPQLQWFKNNEPIPPSDPVLIFSSLTPQDSGNYSCSLRSFKSSASEQIALYVEDTSTFFWIIIIGASLVLVIFITVAVVLITCRRAKTQQTSEEKEETKTPEDVQEQEVQYASVSITHKEPSANIDKQNEDSTIYSAVRMN